MAVLMSARGRTTTTADAVLLPVLLSGVADDTAPGTVYVPAVSLSTEIVAVAESPEASVAKVHVIVVGDGDRRLRAIR